jgi:hypothetical protein
MTRICVKRKRKVPLHSRHITPHQLKRISRSQRKAALVSLGLWALAYDYPHIVAAVDATIQREALTHG